MIRPDVGYLTLFDSGSILQYTVMHKYWHMLLEIDRILPVGMQIDMMFTDWWLQVSQAEKKWGLAFATLALALHLQK